MKTVNARRRGLNIGQGLLFAYKGLLRTQVISRRSQFDSLFEGFAKMRAISYVVSPDLLLEFLEQHGYKELEIIVGENLSESYRQGLEQKSIEVTERLADLVEEGKLRIYVPDRTIHTKLYLLERPESTRVIISSANLTETAREASRQVNYAWYADLPREDPLLSQVSQDYEAHLEFCSLFMDDLRELIRERSDMAKRELIEVWLKGVVSDETDVEIKREIQQITLNSLGDLESSEGHLFRVQLPENPTVRKQMQNFLAPIKPITTDKAIQVNGLSFINYVQETHHFPLLYIDRERRIVRLRLNGTVHTLTEPPPEATTVNTALEHIEAYLQTVDWGQSPDPQYAKTSMFEALLYLFFAPFAHEYMKVRRKRYGAIDLRGPRFLYIYGQSRNGKSTFLRLGLKLLTGYAVETLTGNDFNKRKLATARTLGTEFPLAFDDVNLSTKGPAIEAALKSYWEVWWQENYMMPQIIMSSNAYSLKEWAKSRVKRVDFDVHFAESETNKERLNAIFSSDNAIFKWFSYLYFRHIDSREYLSDDELQVARIVMKQLYEHAQRPLPSFFPLKPIENLYDPGLRAWHDLLDRLGKAKINFVKERVHVTFTEDMQLYEIKEFESYLPQIVKYRRRGKTLIIENPNEFRKWFNGQARPRSSWYSRLIPWKKAKL